MVYEINLCSPLYDQLQDQSVNLRVIRILFGVDLLVLYLVFNFISFLLKKDLNSLRLEDKRSNQVKIESQERFYKVRSAFMSEMVERVSAFFWGSCDIDRICDDIFAIRLWTVPSRRVFPIPADLWGPSAEMVDGNKMAENM